jgi:coenzyme Q-binding protein COQ10
MKHIERHHSHHTPAQLFDLVIDVERYPGIVPFVVAAKVSRRKERMMWVQMTMGMGFLHKRFTTVAELDRPRRVTINSYDPLFERFEQIWTFQPAARGGTDIEYRVDVRCLSHLLQTLLEASFAERATAMVKAYVRWAERRYGRPSDPSNKLALSVGMHAPVAARKAGRQPPAT